MVFLIAVLLLYVRFSEQHSNMLIRVVVSQFCIGISSNMGPLLGQYLKCKCAVTLAMNYEAPFAQMVVMTLSVTEPKEIIGYY